MNTTDENSEQGQLALMLALIAKAVSNTEHAPGMRADPKEKERLVVEIESMFANHELAQRALRELFPEGVFYDSRFFDRLKNLCKWLGWGEHSARSIGALLIATVELLGNHDAESLLRQLPKVPGPFFFEMLNGLQFFAEKQKLRTEFAVEWFPDVLRRINNDFAGGSFWKMLEVYCEKNPENAVAVLGSFTSPKDEVEVALAASMLGTLRTLQLPELLTTKLGELDSAFRVNTVAAGRSVYYRSWIHTAWRGKLIRADMVELLRQMNAGTSDEQESAFWIVCRLLLSFAISSDCFDYGLAWLRANTTATISPDAKHHIVDLAAFLAAKGRWEVEELVLAIQPIAVEHKGTWQRLEPFLVCRLQSDVKAFEEFSLRLARLSGRGWLTIIKEPGCFEWLLSEMHGKDLGSMVGQLVLSDNADCRKIGLFLFDELGQHTLPPDLLDRAGEKGLRLALHELQRTTVHGDAIGRYLIALIPCAQHASSEFQEELYEEMVLQVKNWAIGCRAEYERQAKNFSCVNKALDEAKVYFESLSHLRQSPLTAMDVLGYRHAVRLYSRCFSEEIRKGTEKMSVFMQLFKKTQLLYGKQWSSFHDGKLSEKSALQEISSSVEVPRLEEIDPEGMAHRRLAASCKLAVLSAIGEERISDQ